MDHSISGHDFFDGWKNALRINSLVLVLLASGCIRTMRHDPDSAAVQAILFAKVAIVERNFSTGYRMLAKTTQQQMTAKEFADLMVQLHPKKWPQKISAVEYEPLSGRKAMNIYLYAVEDEETFGYVFLMEGTADDGYKVSAIVRKDNLAPASPPRMQFPRPRTTKDQII